MPLSKEILNLSIRRIDSEKPIRIIDSLFYEPIGGRHSSAEVNRTEKHERGNKGRECYFTPVCHAVQLGISRDYTDPDSIAVLLCELHKVSLPGQVTISNSYNRSCSGVMSAAGKEGRFGTCKLHDGSKKMQVCDSYLSAIAEENDRYVNYDMNYMSCFGRRPTYPEGNVMDIAGCLPLPEGIDRLPIFPCAKRIIRQEYDGKYHYLFQWRGHNYSKVSSACELYCARLKGSPSEQEKLYAIVEYVQQLEWMHPFEDGNCRTFCGALLQILLYQNGFSPSVLKDPNCFDYLTPGQLMLEVVDGQKRYENLLKSGSARVSAVFDDVVGSISRVIKLKDWNVLTGRHFNPVHDFTVVCDAVISDLKARYPEVPTCFSIRGESREGGLSKVGEVEALRDSFQGGDDLRDKLVDLKNLLMQHTSRTECGVTRSSRRFDKMSPIAISNQEAMAKADSNRSGSAYGTFGE